MRGRTDPNCLGHLMKERLLVIIGDLGLYRKMRKRVSQFTKGLKRAPYLCRDQVGAAGQSNLVEVPDIVEQIATPLRILACNSGAKHRLNMQLAAQNGH